MQIKDWKTTISGWPESKFISIAFSSYKLQNYSNCQQDLQECLNVLHEKNDSGPKLYQTYLDMLKFYLETNIDKSLQLSQALLSEEEVESIPVNQENQIRFIQGTALLLGEQFEKANETLKEVYLQTSDDSLKGACTNNFAVAQWFGQLPDYQRNCDHLFIKSLYFQENIAAAQSSVQQAFDKFSKNYFFEFNFQKQESALQLANLSYFLRKEKEFKDKDLM